RAGALLAGVLLAALLLAVAVVQLPVIQRWAAAQVAARLPAGVSIERVALGVLPPRVRLTNVTLAPAGPTFSARACRRRLAALLAGGAGRACGVVDGSAIPVERSADGTVSWGGALAGLLGSPAAGSATQPAAAPAVRLAALPAVAVHDGTI